MSKTAVVGRDVWPFSAGFDWAKSSAYDLKAKARLIGVPNVIEEKLDGWRVLAVNHGGALHLWSRGVSVVTHQRRDLIAEFGRIGCIDDLPLSAGDAVECELLWPSRRAAEVPTALKSCPKELVVKAFGIPYSGGSLVPTLRAQREILEDLDFPRPRLFCHGAETFSPASLSDWANRWGIEGWMIKALDLPYGEGWYKSKREVHVDVIVLDSKDANVGVSGQFIQADGTPMVGALIVGVVCTLDDHSGHACWSLDLEDGRGPVQIREIAAVSGMTLADREWMTAHRGELCGRVCEVEAQAAGGIKDGRLRHPRFTRWREDKPARECLGQELLGQTTKEPGTVKDEHPGRRLKE